MPQVIYNGNGNTAGSPPVDSNNYAANAAFTVENMLVCNVLPPCVATLSAIILLVTVSWPMAAAPRFT